MKRAIALVLLTVLILCGCSAKTKTPFYYCRSNFQNVPIESIFASESRDVTGHEHQLNFLISLYLMGPSAKDYVNPFPADVHLQSTEITGNRLTVHLTSMDAVSDSRFSIASACMALTCFEISRYETVTIVSGSRSITLNANMLTLNDSNIPTDTTTGG